MKIICPPRRTDAADLPRMGGDIVLTLRNRDTDQVEDVLSNGSGAMQVEAGGRYKDLGLVINAASVAAGAQVWGASWYDSVQWVRNMVWFSQCDLSYTAGYTLRDSEPVESNWLMNLVDNASSPGTEAVWRITQVTGQTGLLGYSIKFRMKNEGASEAAYLRLRVQLLGQ